MESHTPVLMQEVLEALEIQPSDVVVDATLGGAGHFAALLAKLGKGGVMIGIDADLAATERAREASARVGVPGVRVDIVHENFRNLGQALDALGIERFDKALFDLGWSSHQLAASHGFSFSADEPLYMTYGVGGRAAAEIVNSSSERELADIIYEYGEERFARRIAAEIVARRAKARILSTGALVEAILAATPAGYHHGRIHPATRTFQALRIAANDELAALEEGLRASLARVAPSGRIAVITFHSLEDRLVKRIFREALERAEGQELAKKPITPSALELAANRRARSAKLRVFCHA